MSTTWPPTLDMLQGAAQRLAKVVEETSGGRFRIEVFPGGQIMPAVRVLRRGLPGHHRGVHGHAQLLGGRRSRRFEWFATIPFGMNPEGMTAWFYQGDGLKLWEETYAAFNLVPRPGPALAPADGGMVPEEDQHDRRLQGAQDAHREPRRQGLRQGRRRPPVLTPAADIYAALERGVIDAAEWVGPHDDMKLGLHKTARYYYYPGWHEPGTMSDSASTARRTRRCRSICDGRSTMPPRPCRSTASRTTTPRTPTALERLKTEFKGKVEVLQLPVPVLRDLKKLSAEVVREESEKTPMARKVHASFTKFQALVGPWDHVAEGAYHQFVAV